MRKLVAAAVVFMVLLSPVCVPEAAASDPVGDFFKKVGRTIFRPQKRKTPSRRTDKRSRSSDGRSTPAPRETPAAEQTDSDPTPQPSASPSPVPERRALSVSPGVSRGDLPYGVPVRGRPGFVTSPYAPTSGHVDVREFESGAEVKDPYSGKVFRTP
ncbi:MAG: hypothetical protein H0T11_04060 [Chthoniobacterales bacterium]|nr:hypothetical protein [Chthoniobacterales bacterium]